MAKREVIFIKDVESKVWGLPVIMRRFFIKTYWNQGGVYMENNRPTYCSSVIKWLEEIKIVTTSQKRADKLSFEYFHKKYPEYGKYIQLF